MTIIYLACNYNAGAEYEYPETNESIRAFYTEQKCKDFLHELSKKELLGLIEIYKHNEEIAPGDYWHNEIIKVQKQLFELKKNKDYLHYMFSYMELEIDDASK